MLFDFNSATLRQSANSALQDIANALVGRPERLQVIGHTDAKGSDQYNLDLSQRRADTVRQALINLGVRENAITSAGHGESQPIAPNTDTNGQDNPTGRQLNRRVEIVVGAGT